MIQVGDKDLTIEVEQGHADEIRKQLGTPNRYLEIGFVMNGQKIVAQVTGLKERTLSMTVVRVEPIQ